MITAMFNGVKMEVQAICTWANPCDVSIFQSWERVEGVHILNPEGKSSQWIQLTADQAEQLIEEIKIAIEIARRMDTEYFEYMKAEQNAS